MITLHVHLQPQYKYELFHISQKQNSCLVHLVVTYMYKMNVAERVNCINSSQGSNLNCFIQSPVC